MSNSNVFIDLITSKKSVITSLAVIVVTILCLTNKVSGETAVDTVKWLVSVWIGAQAFEDSKVKPIQILNDIKKSQSQSQSQ